MKDTSNAFQRMKGNFTYRWYGLPRPFRRLLAFLIFAAVWWRAHILDANNPYPGPFPLTAGVVWITLTVWFIATWPKKKK